MGHGLWGGFSRAPRKACAGRQPVWPGLSWKDASLLPYALEMPLGCWTQPCPPPRNGQLPHRLLLDSST